jgi:hypothetical protein
MRFATKIVRTATRQEFRAGLARRRLMRHPALGFVVSPAARRTRSSLVTGLAAGLACGRPQAVT